MAPRIAARWEEVWDLLPKAMRGDDPEAVHAARVASRRLRATMDGAADAFPKPWFRSLHKSAKAITRTLGHVRDQDVQMERLVTGRELAGAEERAGIDFLVERIAVERDDARAAMARRLGKKRMRRVRKESRARFPLPSGKKRRRPDLPLPGQARERLEGRISDLLSYEPVIPDADAVDELHDARIAVKRLRYTLELFEGAIGDDATQLIQDTKGLQEVLGKLHDLDVSIELVANERDAHADAAESADPQLAASLEAVLGRDQAARQQLHREVVACWDALMAHGFRERLARVTAWR